MISLLHLTKDYFADRALSRNITFRLVINNLAEVLDGGATRTIYNKKF